jgi:eukaryotic-like serine/threonine-protein kinase
LTPERYSQVKSLFQLVLEQPLAQRPAFLERACGADRELYSQVRALLQSDSTSETFLEKPAVTPISKVLADAAAEANEPPPARIGPYAIHQLIGSGGMGAVYLASRADQSFNKQVAIKIIHKGMENDRILQRFRRERQIIASLDHPNIARLLDGGATDDGRPYIVMEYVDGIPIDAWCDQQRLPTARRLHLFLQICDAIHYAHQNLVIHRDIKPGNILVRPDGTVKLLDFGIAKLISSDRSTTPTEKTATSMRLMTPQYASPEQVKGDPVTTASDVYLLGIVLYELLTGHRPYDVKENNTLQAAQAFLQGEPPPPSEAVLRTTQRSGPDGKLHIHRSPALVAAVRDGTPSLLRRKLAGDLDAVLLRALRRNPAERYQSTAQLAADLRNYLQLQPVSAIPDSPAYRLRLFFQRNRTLSATAAAALFLLLATAFLAGWFAWSSRQEHLLAQNRLNEVHKLTNSLLTDVDLALAPVPGTAPARRIMAARTIQYLDSLSAQPRIEPVLRRALAVGYRRVGHLLGGPHILSLGDLATAQATYRKSVALLESDVLDPLDNAELASSLEAIAAAHTAAGDPTAAIVPLRRAVEIREAADTPPHVLAASLQQLGLALAAAEDPIEAQTLARKGQQIAAKITGPDASRQQAAAHSRLADVLHATGERAQAINAALLALQLRRQLAASAPTDPRPAADLAAALETLASLDSTAAPTLGAQALKIRRDQLAANPRNVQARRALALSLLRLGAHDEAIEHFRQLTALNPAHLLALRDLADALEQTGSAHLVANRPDTALTAFRAFHQSATEWLRSYPSDPYAGRTLARAHLRIAQALARTPDRNGAAASARAALRVLEPVDEKDQDLIRLDRARVQSTLGRILAESGSCREAQPQLESAAAAYRDIAARHLLPASDVTAPNDIAAYMKSCRESAAR